MDFSWFKQERYPCTSDFGKEKSSEISLKMLDTAGSLIQSPPVFSHDSKRVMVCCEGRVKIFDSVTGELVSVLQAGMNLSGQLQAIALGPAGMAVGVTGAGEVVCIPVDGRAWSVMTKLDRGLKSLCATGNHLFALSSDGSKVYQVVLEEKPGHPLRAKSFPVVKGAKGISAMATNGSTGFAWSSGKRVWLWSVQSDVSRKTIESVEFDHLITTLAWSSPTDLVAGFSTGGMQVVHGLNLAETGHFAACVARQSKRLHWHSSAVLSTASATDGYLVTGGREAVAVLWNASRGSTQFLPRLGAPILHVSPNVEGNKWALGLEDNSIHIVSSATFSVTCEIRGLVLCDQRSILSICPLDKGAVMVSGSTGSLQFYNPVADKHIGSLRITQENLISALPEHKDRPIQHRQVKLVAKLGSSLLATYESHPEAACLRIWKFSAKTVSFEQVGVWDDPHGAKTAVTVLTFYPSGQLVTADAKGYLRVWGEVSVGSEVYHCSYIAKEPLPSAVSSLELSYDGSLLAVSCGQNVVLLETSGYTLVRSLGTGCHTGTILGAHFFSTESSDHLVVYDNVNLTSWNLRSLQIEWSLNVAITAFSRNEIGPGFAIATASSSNPDDSYVLQFQADSPIPQLARRHSGVTLKGLVFVAHQSTVLLLALTSRATFTQAFPEVQPTDDLHFNSASPLHTPLAKSILEAADRASQDLIPVKRIEVLLPQTSTAKPGELLLTEVPSHVLPSMRLLCASFMNLRLPKAKKN